MLLGELADKNAISRGILMPDGDGLPLRSVRALLGGFAPSWMEAMSTSGAKIRGLLSRELLANLGQRDPYALFVGALDASRLEGRDPVHQAQYLWAKSLLPIFILCVLGDRMEMAHSIEGGCVPRSSRRRAGHANAGHLKIRGMVEKHVLREVARPVRTKTVYRRQKHPFFAPPATTTPGTRLYQMIQDTLRSALPRLPFYDREAVVGLLDKLPSMDATTRAALDPAIVSMSSVAFLQEGLQLSV